MSVIEWLAEPFRFAFMLRGLAAATMVGVLCAVVGAFVVLRGMAFRAMPSVIRSSPGWRPG